MLVWHLALLFLSLLMGTASSQSSGEPGTFMMSQELSGQVVDAFGNGISGVNVYAIPASQDGSILNATTNSTGYYSLDLPIGNYTIMAELPGYSFTSSDVLVQAGAAPSIREIIGYPISAGIPGSAGASSQTPAPQPMQNTPAPLQSSLGTTGGIAWGGIGWVAGKMVDQSGTGIPYASIIVDGIPTGTTTDWQGNYILALRPGMHRISAMRSGFGIPPRVVMVSAGQTTSFNLIGKSTVTLGISKRIA